MCLPSSFDCWCCCFADCGRCFTSAALHICKIGVIDVGICRRKLVLVRVVLRRFSVTNAIETRFGHLRENEWRPHDHQLSCKRSSVPQNSDTLTIPLTHTHGIHFHTERQTFANNFAGSLHQFPSFPSSFVKTRTRC